MAREDQDVREELHFHMFFLQFEQVYESQTVIEKLESSQADLMKGA